MHSGMPLQHLKNSVPGSHSTSVRIIVFITLNSDCLSYYAYIYALIILIQTELNRHDITNFQPYCGNVWKFLSRKADCVIKS